MHRLTKSLALASASLLTATVVALPASAAPSQKGNTEIIPNDTLASLLVSVEDPFQGGELGGVEFGIVGNPSKGVVKHVGGITITTLAGAELELRNFWIDLDAGTVSAIVNDGDRLTLFTLDGTTLLLNDTSSTAIAGDTSLSGAPVAEADVSEWAF